MFAICRCMCFLWYGLSILFIIYITNKFMEHSIVYGIISGINAVSIVVLCDVMRSYLSFKYYKGYMCIFFILLFSILPYCMNNFFFGDDLWAFSSFNNSTTGISLHRPFIDLYINMISPLSYNETHIIRMVFIIIHYFFAISFYTYLCNKKYSTWICLFISVLVSCNVFVIDFLGYISIFPVILSNLYVFYAYVNWKLYYLEKDLKNLIAGVFLFVSACMHYPIIATIIFGYILIDVIFENERIGKVLGYIILYCISMMIYLLSSRIVLNMFGVPISPRAVTITTYEEGLFKLKWFIFDVMPSTLNHFMTCFCGNLFTKTSNMFYTVEFIVPGLTDVFCATFIVCIGYVGYQIFITKRYLCCCYLLFSLPMSFMFWLVLGESTILTYYTYPLCFCAGVIIIAFVWFVLQKYGIFFNKWYRTVIISLILVVVLSSNIYANNFWVKYNAAGYEFIRGVVATEMTHKIRAIHIYGKINPMYINTYAVMATKLILRDMNLDYENYKITSSDDDNILSGMTCDEKELLYSNLSEEQKKVFDDNYIPNEKYPVYYLKPKERAANDFIAIKAMLISGGALPEKNDSTIIVDLNKGFVKFNQF